MVKNLPANAGGAGSIPGSEALLEKEMEPTPVFLSGKSYGQRSLVGYSPSGLKRVEHDSATKQQLSIDINF